MDLYDDETQTRITAMLELPGVARDNMSVVVRDEKLVVTGTRNSPLAARLNSPTPPQDARASRQNSDADVPVVEEVNPAKYRFRELKFGRFRREIDIPAGTQVRSLLNATVTVADASLFRLAISSQRCPMGCCSFPGLVSLLRAP